MILYLLYWFCIYQFLSLSNISDTFDDFKLKVNINKKLFLRRLRYYIFTSKTLVKHGVGTVETTLNYEINTSKAENIID